MDFKIIDKAKHYDKLARDYKGENIWLVVEKPNGKLGVCIEKSFERFKKDFINKEAIQIKVVQYFEDDSFYYTTESNSFLMRGI